MNIISFTLQRNSHLCNYYQYQKHHAFDPSFSQPEQHLNVYHSFLQKVKHPAVPSDISSLVHCGIFPSLFQFLQLRHPKGFLKLEQNSE